MRTQKGETAGWAIGEVALWGRLVEHQNGWRAQFAYPGTLSVESEDERIASALAREYAIRTSWSGPNLVQAIVARAASEPGIA